MDYNSIAERYDDGYSSPFFAQEDEAVKSMISQRVGSVLDIGCGTGLGISISGASKEEYVGIDVSGKIIEVAKRKNPGYKFLNERVISFRNDTRFGIAIALYGVMNYLTDEEVERAIEISDSFFFMDYIDGYHPVCYPNNEFPVRRFSEKKFEKLRLGKFNNYNLYGKGI